MIDVSADVPLENGEVATVAQYHIMDDGSFAVWFRAPRAGVYRLSHPGHSGLIVIEANDSGWEYHHGAICFGRG